MRAGSFTGATGSRTGFFEDASDGTLFLDEIGELPLDLQPKLLRVLENGEYQRVGETLRRQSHARIIAATNRDLRTEIREGRFRADLYHRLRFTLQVPPLRELGRIVCSCSSTIEDSSPIDPAAPRSASPPRRGHAGRSMRFRATSGNCETS